MQEYLWFVVCGAALITAVVVGAISCAIYLRTKKTLEEEITGLKENIICKEDQLKLLDEENKKVVATDAELKVQIETLTSANEGLQRQNEELQGKIEDLQKKMVYTKIKPLDGPIEVETGTEVLTDNAFVIAEKQGTTKATLYVNGNIAKREKPLIVVKYPSGKVDIYEYHGSYNGTRILC